MNQYLLLKEILAELHGESEEFTFRCSDTWFINQAK